MNAFHGHRLTPFMLATECWPDLVCYDKQVEIVESVWRDDETIVPAGNMLGKDFIAGFVALTYFLLNPVVRIVTTSVKDDHLRVLWGEIGRFISTSRIPLTADKGGPLIVNHRDIRKRYNGKLCDISYLRGMVSESGEGMAGHHAAATLAIIDEASGVDDLVYTQLGTWARHILIIGNPNPVGNNHFFKRLVRGGDVVAQ